MKTNMRYVKIGSGLSFIALLLFFSFFPELILGEIDGKETGVLYDSEGQLIGAPPFSPVEFPPLGTNKLGEPLLYSVVDGAKYTIIFIILICIFRFLFAMAAAIFYAFYVKKSQQFLKRIIDIVYFIPPVIIVYFLLGPITAMYPSGETINVEYLIMQALVLTIVAIPPLMFLLGDEIKLTLKEDFIKISKLAGVSKFYLFKKHIWILLKPRILIFFIQEVIHLLFLLIHLGVLNVFIGGKRTVKMTKDTKEDFSLSNEWAGLIGDKFDQFLIHPWIILVPLGAFTLLIFALKLILSGLEDRSTNQ